MHIRKIILFVVANVFVNFSMAETITDSGVEPRASSTPVTTKIYSQVVSFNLPHGFALVSAKQEAGNYVQKYSKSVQEGDLEQKLLLFGIQGLAKTDNAMMVTSELFKKTTQSQCPETFAMDNVGTTTIQSGQSAFVFLAGCGFRKPLEKSDLAKTMSLFVVIQGKDDFYVFQWSEGSITAQMPTLSWPIWRKRLESLMPLSLQ